MDLIDDKIVLGCPPFCNCCARTQGQINASSRREVAYLAAPLHTYEINRYDEAMWLVSNRHPGYPILSPRDIWKDNQTWQTYKTILAPVAIRYVLTGEGGFGFEVRTEFYWLSSQRRTPVHLVFGLGPNLAIIDCGRRVPYNGGSDWNPYVKLERTDQENTSRRKRESVRW